MKKRTGSGGAYYARGVSLLEIIVVIVVLGIMGVAFMSMYADVTRRNAAASQTAGMTWVGQGVMEAFSNSHLCCATGTYNATFGPYKVAEATTKIPGMTVKTAAGTYSAYKITVSVSCVSGSCVPMMFTADAYTI